MNIFERPRKIRIIVGNKNTITPAYGLTLPDHFKTWLGINIIKIIESGGNIILQSGALPEPMTKTQFRIETKTIETITI